MEKVNKNCIWSAEGKTIFLKCSVVLNYRLNLMGEESVTSIHLYDEFYVKLNLLFDRCAHIWVKEVAAANISWLFRASSCTIDDYHLNFEVVARSSRTKHVQTPR